MAIEVVGAYIELGGKFLLAQRTYGELEGMWEFPGGKIEKGESENDAIIREIREELELDIIPTEKIGIFTHTYPFGEINLHLMRCELSDSIPVELPHVLWVTQDDIPVLLAPLDQQIVNFLARTS